MTELAGNERGIPKAPFVDVVENFLAGSDAENLMRKVKHKNNSKVKSNDTV